MKKNKLSIVIVTFNSENYIEKCVESISKSNSDEIEYKVIIIDNSSTDATVKIVALLAKTDHRITLISNRSNFGFAKAVNQGILIAKADQYILLLNPDTMLEKHSLIELIKCLKKNDAGICGGETVGLSGKSNGSYFRFPNLMVGLFDFTNLRKLSISDKWHKYFYYKENTHRLNESYPVDVVTGGFMLISRSTVNNIGLFDESFFMYLEDVDYCLRAQKNGIKTFHSEKSKIIHIGGASSSNKDKIRHSSWLKSRKIYFLKHFGIFTNIIIQPIFLIDDIIILIFAALNR